MLDIKKTPSLKKLTLNRWAFGERDFEHLTRNFLFGTDGLVHGYNNPDETS
jgi:hypothetical protein